MVIFILPIYTKWKESPTIVSPESTNYPIWNIYFPAITICSNAKVVEEQLKSVLKKEPWTNLTELNDLGFDFDLEDGLKNAISNTILYEVEPFRIKNNSAFMNVSDEYLLNNYHHALPKAMQKVSTYSYVPNRHAGTVFCANTGLIQGTTARLLISNFFFKSTPKRFKTFLCILPKYY